MDEIQNNCNLVGPVGILVQAILIVLIFTAVKSTPASPVKHHYERPRRILHLFFMDGAKQLLSNGLLHVANVVISVFVGDQKQHDQCGV
jgi:hypothetical protein